MDTRMINKSAKEAGFTLIEMMIVVLIIGIISYVIAAGFMMSSRTMKTMERRSDVAAFLQEAVERSVDSLRGASSIVTAASDTITVVVNGSQTTIAYDPNAKTITKNGGVLGANISGCTITYYDVAGAATTTISAIKSAKFTINGISSGEPWTLESTVMFRRLHPQV